MVSNLGDIEKEKHACNHEDIVKGAGIEEREWSFSKHEVSDYEW